MRFKNHIAGFATLLAAASPAPQPVSAASYTVYYADDKGWQAGNTLVHVWNGPTDIPYLEWADNEPMEATGKFLNLDGRYLPVYSYSFEWDMEPTGIVIHNNPQPGGLAMQTRDYEFVDGAIYVYVDPKDYVSDPIVDNPVILDASELPSSTIYFADTGNWGPDNTQVHIWGSNGDFSPYASDPTMTDTGLYARVNDVWARVYSFNYFYGGTVDGVLFHLKDTEFLTADLPAADGAMYTYCGNRMPSPVCATPVLVEAIPSDQPVSASLYVNLGANQMMQAGLWDEPCAHVYRREGEMEAYESLLPEYGSEEYQAEVMTKIRDGFYRVDIDDISRCNDVVFYYSSVDEQGNQTYQDLVFPASRGIHNDPSTWATFIYDIGIDCVHQSYLTPEEYNAGWEESPAALFLTGNELVTGVAGDDPANSVRIESDDDVYIHKFTIAEGDVASFKLSRFDTYGAATAHGFSMDDKTYDSQRGWATFNLGIIGFQNDDVEGWYDRYIYSPGNGQSRHARLWLNESVNFNNYTQYPWRVGDGEGGVSQGDYWLVIDLHDDDHSLSLLEFDPNPSVEMSAGGFNVMEIGYGGAAMAGASGHHDGAAANGEVLFDRVNVVSANAAVTGRDEAYLSSLDFTVAYTAYVGDVAVAKGEGLPPQVGIPFLTPGEDNNVAVRARYTDTNTHRSFCSRKAHASVTAPIPELATPQEIAADGLLFMYFAAPGDAEAMKVTVGGAVTLPYMLDGDTSHAFYPDYSVERVSTGGMEAPAGNTIVYASHPVAPHRLFDNYLGKMSGAAWIPWEGDTEYDDACNWSKLVAAEGQLPLFVNQLTVVGSLDPVVESTASIRLDAVYPFLTVSPSGESLPAAARAAGHESEATGVLPAGASVVTMRTSAMARADFSGQTVSGVEEVASTSPAATDTRYYTVGGAPLASRPVLPGVYIQVASGHASKLVVR